MDKRAAPTGSMTIPCTSWTLQGPSNKDLVIFEIYMTIFNFIKKKHSLYQLNIMEHICGYCCTLPKLKVPSWTFMDTKMHPLNGPCKSDFRQPLVKKGPPESLHGPN